MSAKALREMLDPLIRALLGNFSCQLRLSAADVSSLIAASRPVLLQEPSLLELHAPLHICGDTHGQFPDLLRIFESAEPPPNGRFLFLGDYVDRGPMSLEVICLLLALKVRYPSHVFLLRGNHETREATETYGFAAECTAKLNRQVYNEFCDLFEALPIGAVIGGKLFCVHGGLSPELATLDQVRGIARPADASFKGLLANLLWSDPSTEVADFGPSDRGDTVVWNLPAVRRFLDANGLTTLIRAHQLVHMGFEYPFAPDESVLTVFSAPCYAGEFANRGAFLFVDKDLSIEPILLPHDPTSMREARAQRAETPRPGAPGKGKKEGKGKKDGKGRKGKRK
jgi:serine/threonine-protein phosphatase PP1 catalytic subunit